MSFITIHEAAHGLAAIENNIEFIEIKTTYTVFQTMNHNEVSIKSPHIRFSRLAKASDEQWRIILLAGSVAEAVVVQRRLANHSNVSIPDKTIEFLKTRNTEDYQDYIEITGGEFITDDLHQTIEFVQQKFKIILKLSEYLEINKSISYKKALELVGRSVD